MLKVESTSHPLIRCWSNAIFVSAAVTYCEMYEIFKAMSPYQGPALWRGNTPALLHVKHHAVTAAMGSAHSFEGGSLGCCSFGR